MGPSILGQGSEWVHNCKVGVIQKEDSVCYQTLPTDQTIHYRILSKVCCDVFICWIRKSAAMKRLICQESETNPSFGMTTTMVFRHISAWHSSPHRSTCPANLSFLLHITNKSLRLKIVSESRRLLLSATHEIEHQQKIVDILKWSYRDLPGCLENYDLRVWCLWYGWPGNNY